MIHKIHNFMWYVWRACYWGGLAGMMTFKMPVAIAGAVLCFGSMYPIVDDWDW